MLRELLKAGMSVARFNFSHGDHAYHQDTLDTLRAACDATGMTCGVLLDTKGPEIRTGLLERGEKVTIEQGSHVTLTTDYTAHGCATRLACSYPKLAEDVAPGAAVLVADGSLTLKVLACDAAKGEVLCEALNTASIGEKKNMNLPGVVVDLPTITEKDKVDLLDFGVKNKVDFVAASFVRKGSDVRYIRNVLGEAGAHIKIIAKVENMEGLDNYDDIVEASDGVMVARGDLGMEIPMEKMFLAQKRMIKRCNIAGKFVITATQMLESMCQNPRPTRAESTDVANAVIDGTDAVMLSGETAAGAHPLAAVSVMRRICDEAEASQDHYAVFRNTVESQPPGTMTVLESLASSAVRSAQKVHAAAIIVLSCSGNTARLVAKYRPQMPVITVAVPPVDSMSDADARAHANMVARGTSATRGLVATVPPPELDHVNMPLKAQLKWAAAQCVERGVCRPGDLIVACHKVDEDAVLKIVNVDGSSAAVHM